MAELGDIQMLRCKECGTKSSADNVVSRINCGYESEINGNDIEEIICELCERRHLDEI